MNSSSITCSLSIEYLNNQKSVIKTTKCKTATLDLIRNEFRDLFVKVTADSVHLKLKCENLNMHKKFASEGKASMNFNDRGVVIYISNAPPSGLIFFLKTLFIKMSSSKNSPKLSVRDKMLSCKTNSIQEISPVNVKDIGRVKNEIDVKDVLKRKRTDGSVLISKSAKKQCLSDKINFQLLNNEQKCVLEAIKRGSNIFFTGSAGTGKSFLLKFIINSLPPDSTVATASTGSAACLIGGVTLHSFAGIGNGDGNFERCLQLANRPHVLQSWKKCKHLIIDEISMVNGKFFQKLETIARKIRCCDKPFGGIQLILCGDFFQLPPVTQDVANKFCFQTEAWRNCRFSVFQLRQVHRQADPEFIDILNSLRYGRLLPEVADKLIQTKEQEIGGEGIQATRLCCYTQEANVINATNLERIEAEQKVFKAVDNGNSKTLDDLTPVLSEIVLKVGSQVMLLKNINVNKGLVNGARGVIVKFLSGLPVVKFLNTEYTVTKAKWSVRTSGGGVLTRQQIPLCLAWAFSIHKSQGLTLDCVEMTLAQVFEAGQAYVALSRAKSLSSLRVIDFDPKKVWANPEVLNFYKRLDILEKKAAQISEIIPLGVYKNKLTR